MGNVISHALRTERGADLLHKVTEGVVVAAHKVRCMPQVSVNRANRARLLFD